MPLFHRATHPDGLVEWLTVASDAAKIDPDFQKDVEIQTDKASVQQLLNDCEQQLHKLRQELAATKIGVGVLLGEEQEPAGQEPNAPAAPPLTAPEPAAVPLPVQPITEALSAGNMRAIVEWIYRAQPIQISSLFASIGSRFAELRDQMATTNAG